MPNTYARGGLLLRVIIGASLIFSVGNASLLISRTNKAVITKIVKQDTSQKYSPLVVLVSASTVANDGSVGSFELQRVKALRVLLTSDETDGTSKQTVIIISIGRSPVFVVGVRLIRSLPSLKI